MLKFIIKILEIKFATFKNPLKLNKNMEENNAVTNEVKVQSSKKRNDWKIAWRTQVCRFGFCSAMDVGKV